MKLPDFSLDERFLELRRKMGIADSSILGEAARPLRVEGAAAFNAGICFGPAAFVRRHIRRKIANGLQCVCYQSWRSRGSGGRRSQSSG